MSSFSRIWESSLVLSRPNPFLSLLLPGMFLFHKAITTILASKHAISYFFSFTVKYVQSEGLLSQSHDKNLANTQPFRFAVTRFSTFPMNKRGTEIQTVIISPMTYKIYLQIGSQVIQSLNSL